MIYIYLKKSIKNAKLRVAACNLQTSKQPVSYEINIAV